MSTRIHPVPAPSDITELRRGILHAEATDPCEPSTDRPTSHTPWTDGVRRHQCGETNPISPRCGAFSSTFPNDVGVGKEGPFWWLLSAVRVRGVAEDWMRLEWLAGIPQRRVGTLDELWTFDLSYCSSFDPFVVLARGGRTAMQQQNPK